MLARTIPRTPRDHARLSPPAAFETPAFFTVALATRTSDLLTGQIDRLRDAAAQTCAERPFGTGA